MFEDFKKTLVKVFHLRSIIGYNGLVYSLKMTPVLGKIIPDSLYSSTGLKIIYWIIHMLKEFFLLFIGKIFGLGMVYLAAVFLKSVYIDYDVAAGASDKALFGSFVLFFFLLYALCGVMINTRIFSCNTEKEYLVFMLRMNARKLNLTLFVYDLLKLVTGYLITGIIAGILGAPFWIWLGIPVLAVFIKLFGAGAQAWVYESKNRHNRLLRNSDLSLVVRLIIIMLCMPAVFVLVINGYIVPLRYLLIVSGILILLGIWGFFKLKGSGPELHRRALRDNIGKEEITRSSKTDKTVKFKKIRTTGTFKTELKGFDYLNALFVKRHRKMLIIKPAAFTAMAAIVAFILIYEFIYAYYHRFGSADTWNMVGNNLINILLFRCYDDPLLPYDIHSTMSFFRYLAQSHLPAFLIPIACTDISFTATQAMYINCDNSLMTFSFFKQREKIIKLFDIRLRQLIRINMVPAVAFGLFADLMLFYTGGQDYPLHYLVTLLVPVIMCAAASVTGLATYYLFQPFTTDVNIKSGAYKLFRVISGFIQIWIFWIPLHSLIVFGVLTVFTALYIYLLRKAVYKHAPKTWRVKA